MSKEETEYIMLDISRSPSRPKVKIDQSVGLDVLFKQLVYKATMQTGKPVVLNVTISMSENQKTFLEERVYDQDFQIFPVIYGIHTKIPKMLANFKDILNNLYDISFDSLSNYPISDYNRERRAVIDKLIKEYEIFYSDVFKWFTDPSKQLHQKITNFQKHFNTVIQTYFQKNVAVCEKLNSALSACDNSSIMNFFDHNSAKYALESLKKYDNATIDAMMDEYAKQLSELFICTLARRNREFDIESKRDGIEMKTIENLSYLTLGKKQDKFSEKYYNLNDPMNASAFDFLRLCERTLLQASNSLGPNSGK